MPLYLIVLFLITLLDVRLLLFPPVVGEELAGLLLLVVPLLSFLGVRSAVRSAAGEADLARLTCGASVAFLLMVMLRKALMAVPGVSPLLFTLVFITEIRLLGAAFVNVVLAIPLFLKSPNRPYAIGSWVAAVAGLQLIARQELSEWWIFYGYAVVWLSASFAYGLLWGALVQKLFRSRV